MSASYKITEQLTFAIDAFNVTDTFREEYEGSSAKLRRWRKGAVLVILAVGYLITPGADPITPLPLIIPLLLLYEGSILVIRRMGR